MLKLRRGNRVKKTDSHGIEEGTVIFTLHRYWGEKPPDWDSRPKRVRVQLDNLGFSTLELIEGLVLLIDFDWNDQMLTLKCGNRVKLIDSDDPPMSWEGSVIGIVSLQAQVRVKFDTWNQPTFEEVKGLILLIDLW